LAAVTAFCWEGVKFDVGAADVVGLLEAEVVAEAGLLEVEVVLEAEVVAEAAGLVEPVPFFDPHPAAAKMMTMIASAQ
jgi:hypothetical protein